MSTLTVPAEEAGMNSDCQAYTDVYQVLAGVCFRGASPVGCRGSLFSAIHRLRGTAAPQEHIEIAERISVALHRLEWAMLHHDQMEETAIRDELRALGECWRETPIPLSLT